MLYVKTVRQEVSSLLEGGAKGVHELAEHVKVQVGAMIGGLSILSLRAVYHLTNEEGMYCI